MEQVIGPPLLFIAGMPAAGKSYFGQWLATHHGFTHIDPEENTLLDDLAVRDSWNMCWSARRCEPFVERLRQLGRVVFNWGFPPALVGVAAALKDAGFSAWWFDAPIAVARRAYKKNMDDFDLQVPAILAARAAIDAVFAQNMLRTLDDAGNRMLPEDIWRAILSSSGGKQDGG